MDIATVVVVIAGVAVTATIVAALVFVRESDPVIARARSQNKRREKLEREHQRHIRAIAHARSSYGR